MASETIPKIKKKKRGFFGLGGKSSAPLDDLEHEAGSGDIEDADSDEGRGFVPGSQYTAKKPSSLSNLSTKDDDGGGGERGRGRGRGRDAGGDDGGRDRSRSRSVSVTRALKRMVGVGKKKDKEKEKEKYKTPTPTESAVTATATASEPAKKFKKKKDKVKKIKRGGKREEDGEDEYLSRGSESMDFSNSEGEDPLASDGEGKARRKKRDGAAVARKKKANRPRFDGDDSGASLDLSLDGSVKGKSSGRGRKLRAKKDGDPEGSEGGYDSMGSIDYDLDDAGSIGTGRIPRTPPEKRSTRPELFDDLFDEGSAELASGDADGGVGGGINDDCSIKSGKSTKSTRSARSTQSGRNSPKKKGRGKKVAEELPMPVLEGGTDDEHEQPHPTFSTEKRKSFPVDIQDLRKEVSKRHLQRRIQSVDPQRMARGQREGSRRRSRTPRRLYDDEQEKRGISDDDSLGAPKDLPSRERSGSDQSNGGLNGHDSQRSRGDDWPGPRERGSTQNDTDGSAEFKVTPRKELDDYDSFRASWNQSARAEREEDASTGETVGELKDKLKMQKKETEMAQAQLVDALDMVSQLTGDLNRAATTGEELIEVQRELNEMAEDRFALQKVLDRLEDELATKERRIENLEVAIETQLDKVELLESKLEQTEDQMFNLEDEVRRLEDDQQIKVLDDYDKRLQVRGSLKMERQERKSLFRADSETLLKGLSPKSRKVRDGASKSKKGVIFESSVGRSMNLSDIEDSNEEGDGRHMKSLNTMAAETDNLGALGSSMRAGQFLGQSDDNPGFDERVTSLDAWEKELEEREKQLEADRELDEMKERRLDDWERELEEKELALTQRSVAEVRDGDEDDAQRDLVRRERELAEDRKTLQAEKRRVIAASLQAKQVQLEELENENKSLQRNHTGELFQTRLQLKKKDDEIFFLKDEMDKLRKDMEEMSKGDEKKSSEATDRQEGEKKKMEEELFTIQNGVNRQLRDLDDKNNLLQKQLQEAKDKAANVDELETRVATLELELRVKEKEKEELESEIKKLRMHEESDRKQQEKKRKKEEAMLLLQQEMTCQLAELDDENQTVTKKLTLKQRELDDMLDEKEEIIADLNDTLEELKKNLESTDSGAYVTTLLRDLNDLKKKKRAVDKLERDLLRATEELDEKDVLLSKSKKEIAELKDDLDLVLMDTDEVREKADRAEKLENDLLLAEQELAKLKKEIAEKDAERLRIKDSFTELMKAEARQAEKLAAELKMYKDDAKDIDGSFKMKKDGGDDYAAKLKKELKTLKDDHKALKKQLKVEQQKASDDIRKKDESIKFFQDEMVRLKKDAENKFKSQKRTSDNRDKERRIVELEDEVHHWKAVSISLEDQVELWKSDALELKAKADGKFMYYDDDDDQSIASMTSARHNEDPLQVSQHSISSKASKDYLFYGGPDKIEASPRTSDIDDSASQRAARSVASLWSTLVTPKGPPTAKVNSAIPSYFSG
jgi:hypothetical protein